ncbi:MAG TPA: hypothetical protein VF345_07300, partial [Chthoniobacterales bacterium]
MAHLPITHISNIIQLQAATAPKNRIREKDDGLVRHHDGRIAGCVLLIFLSDTILESLPRYLSVLFPLHMGLAAATARSEGLYLGALVTST